MKFNSIRFKISILYTSILGLVLIIYSCVLYFSLHNVLYNELDNELKTKGEEIRAFIIDCADTLGVTQETFIFSARRAINREGEHAEQKKIRYLEKRWAQTYDKLNLAFDYISIIGRDGNPVVQSADLLPGALGMFAEKLSAYTDRESFATVKFQERNLRVANLPFFYDEKVKYYIQIGTSLKPVMLILRNRLRFIAVSIPAILLVTSFLGRLFAARILKPVLDVTHTAQQISYRDLSARVKFKHIDEEMKSLVNSFNDMIARLQRSFNHIAEFSSNVAHELKTPLAIMRGESELALLRERSPEEYRRVIKSNLDETTGMLKVIEDLLLLARLDYQPEVFKFEQLDLIPFFEEVYEQSKILTSRKNIKVSIDIPQAPIYARADQVHLRRLFLNLIQNAIKFNRDSGTIDILLATTSEKALISIIDTGMGIADEDLPKVFSRFFHKESAGHEAEPGNGLGLSIAQSIAKIHKGHIEAKSQHGKGSTFTVVLPRLKPS